MAAASGIDPSNTGATQILQEGRAGASSALAAKGGIPQTPGSQEITDQASKLSTASKARVAAMRAPPPAASTGGDDGMQGAPPASAATVAQSAQNAEDDGPKSITGGSAPQAPPPAPAPEAPPPEDQSFGENKVNHLMNGFTT